MIDLACLCRLRGVGSGAKYNGGVLVHTLYKIGLEASGLFDNMDSSSYLSFPSVYMVKLITIPPHPMYHDVAPQAD